MSALDSLLLLLRKMFHSRKNNLFYNVRDSFTRRIFFGPVLLICILHVRLF